MTTYRDNGRDRTSIYGRMPAPFIGPRPHERGDPIMCRWCGATFVADRVTARYCTPTCSNRAHHRHRNERTTS